MSNLYKMDKSAGEVARQFNAINAVRTSHRHELVYAGYPGLVVAEGEVRVMSWGFPLGVKAKRGRPPALEPAHCVPTAELRSPPWRSCFESSRCLIPVTAFAEPEGPKRRMTQTWISISGNDPFVCGGVWRYCTEWGSVFSMVMTDPCPSTAGIHDRMPVILQRDDWDVWLNGSTADAELRCVPWGGECTIERTFVPWSAGPLGPPQSSHDRSRLEGEALIASLRRTVITRAKARDDPAIRAKP